jgi:hypothetical protein
MDVDLRLSVRGGVYACTVYTKPQHDCREGGCTGPWSIDITMRQFLCHIATCMCVHMDLDVAFDAFQLVSTASLLLGLSSKYSRRPKREICIL